MLMSPPVAGPSPPRTATVVGCRAEALDEALCRYVTESFQIGGIARIGCAGSLPLLAGRGSRVEAHEVRARVSTRVQESASSVLVVVADAECDECGGAPDERIGDMCDAVERLTAVTPGIEVAGIWVDEAGGMDRLA
jgi:hypothetical protein